jgi:hypothetical protein
MATAKTKLKNQAFLVNVAILAALGLEYFRGVPIFAILIAGTLLLLTVNIIFFIRWKRPKKMHD